ncbi:MAG: hypothetical protein WCE73_12890, partial [Candidatus Angelobacter sp.]
FAADLPPFQPDGPSLQGWKDVEEALGSLAAVVAGFHWFAPAGRPSKAGSIETKKQREGTSLADTSKNRRACQYAFIY